MTRPATLILAGRRASSLDPLAAAAGVTHKSLVPVAGVPMVVRVLRTVAEAWPDAPIYLSVEDFGVVANEPLIAELYAAGRLTPVEAQHNIVDSVITASRTTGFPLVITTADNVLLTADALNGLVAEGARGEADAIVVMAEKTDIRAAHPDGQRRFYEFKDGGFSNCNLFWLGSERALKATDSFREGGQFAKYPARIVKAFGLVNLIRFRLGIDPIARAFRAISRRFGVRIVPWIVTDGRLAIDVDNERTHRVAEEILARDAAR